MLERQSRGDTDSPKFEAVQVTAQVGWLSWPPQRAFGPWGPAHMSHTSQCHRASHTNKVVCAPAMTSAKYFFLVLLRCDESVLSSSSGEMRLGDCPTKRVLRGKTAPQKEQMDSLHGSQSSLLVQRASFRREQTHEQDQVRATRGAKCSMTHKNISNPDPVSSHTSTWEQTLGGQLKMNMTTTSLGPEMWTPLADWSADIDLKLNFRSRHPSTFNIRIAFFCGHTFPRKRVLTKLSGVHVSGTSCAPRCRDCESDAQTGCLDSWTCHVSV